MGHRSMLSLLWFLLILTTGLVQVRDSIVICSKCVHPLYG